MALSDIIQAINAQAEKEIAQIRDTAEREKQSVKAKNDAELQTFAEHLQAQTNLKKKQMQRKAETMVEKERKHMILTEKRRALDHVYALALKELQNLPADKKKKLIEALKKNVSSSDGKIEESKEGGFMFVSTKAEENYTFPHLVEHMLRPNTELEASAKLFA